MLGRRKGLLDGRCNGVGRRGWMMVTEVGGLVAGKRELYDSMHSLTRGHASMVGNVINAYLIL